jgi:hypothetical protein
MSGRRSSGATALTLTPREGHCDTCKFWTPVHRSIGQCKKEGTIDAIFWVSDQSKPLLTQRSFGCVQHEKYVPESNDTL